MQIFYEIYLRSRAVILMIISGIKEPARCDACDRECILDALTLSVMARCNEDAAAAVLITMQFSLRCPSL